MIHSAVPSFTRIGLAHVVRATFGENARFHTCSAESLTLDQLLIFLISRKKVVEREGCLQVVLANVCGHDH
jgi:probable metal-binding protein